MPKIVSGGQLSVENWRKLWSVRAAWGFWKALLVSLSFTGHGEIQVALNIDRNRYCSQKSKKAEEEDIEAFIRMAQSFADTEDQQNADAVLHVSISANEEAHENMKNPDMCEAPKDLMKDEIQEERLDAAVQERVINIKSLMEKLDFSPNQVMDALSILVSEQRKYLAML